MNTGPGVTTPRSIERYLEELRRELAGEDAALVQDALYDAEEYLRAEVAAHPDKSEADVLELIGASYGAPDEVAAAYRDTEAKVATALKTPVRPRQRTIAGKLFDVYLDPHTYTSLLLMILSLATGIIYFTFAVTGAALSAGFSVLIIGVPFFLLFIGIARIVALAEGRLLEAMTGERMPRRPAHPGPPLGFWAKVGDMLRDRRTWSTLAYLILMLPLGITYFVTAVTGLSVSVALILAPFAEGARRLGWWHFDGVFISPPFLGSLWLLPFVVLAGVLLLTLLMHLARGIGRLHATYAKALLVSPATGRSDSTAAHFDIDTGAIEPPNA